MRFFFYGTLIDPDVRRVVLGARAAATIESRPAILPGWERRAVRGAGYPVIIRRASGSVDGMLACGLDAQARRRLVDYEGRGYDLIRVAVVLDDGRRRTALVFAPAAGGELKPAPGAWSYPRWLRRSKRAFLREIDRRRAAERP